MELNELRARTLDDFRSRVHGVRDDQWDAPTPCTEWDVRALVNHLASELRWSVPLAAGRTLDEVGDRFDGDVLGEDPAATTDEAAEASVAAFRGEHAHAVHTSQGLLPVEHYLTQMLTDSLVHSWDLAVATGQSTELDAEACAEAYQRALAGRGEIDAARKVGLFGAEIVVPDDASDCDKLLGLLGRDPRAGS